MFWGKIKTNCFSIFECFYLTHFSTFTFSELSNFSKAFLNQVVNVESASKNVPNRYFQAKSSISVHFLSSHNDANTMIWKLQEFGGQFYSACETTFFFWNTVIEHRNNIIIFIGFFSLTNQRSITDNLTPYIFVSVVYSAVWAVNYELKV